MKIVRVLRINGGFREKILTKGRDRYETGGKETHHLGGSGSEAARGGIRAYGEPEGKLRGKFRVIDLFR